MPPAGVALERFHRANAYHPRAGWLDSWRIGLLWLRALLETTTTRPGGQSGGRNQVKFPTTLCRSFRKRQLWSSQATLRVPEPLGQISFVTILPLRNWPRRRPRLGRINTAQVFSPSPSPDKISYTVGKGDSLVKIASKFKSNAELIFRANKMETINLKIGQKLVIPQLDISVVVDRKAGTVTLLNKGQFFKEYRTLSLKTPGVATSAKTKVADKIALRGSNRVAFGDKNYSGSERWVMLGSAGLAIRSLPEGAENPPPGIIVTQDDMEEIFLLVSRGSPVTIQ